MLLNATNMIENLIQMKKRFDDHMPEKLHPCPLLRDDLKDINVSSSIKQDFEKMLPHGEYRYDHKFWNEEDDLIFFKSIYERFNTGIMKKFDSSREQ